MSTGWIKLHRQFLEWEWYDDSNTKCLFLHCLLRANHADTEWRGHKIKRGQFLTSVDTLARETGLSVSKIRTSLKKLVSTNELASKSQARSTVITVVAYDTHQVSDKPVSNKVTLKSQPVDNEIATDKNLITKEPKKEDICQLILDKWSELFKNELPIPLKLTQKRRSAINGCIKEMKTTKFDFTSLQTWSEYFEHAAKSDWLMGRTEKSDWTMQFDFVITKSKLLKIVEGEYDN